MHFMINEALESDINNLRRIRISLKKAISKR